MSSSRAKGLKCLIFSSLLFFPPYKVQKEQKPIFRNFANESENVLQNRKAAIVLVVTAGLSNLF